MPVYQYLDLSTAHITKKDAEMLGWWESVPLVARHEYGFFVNVPSNLAELRSELIKDGFSEAFIGVLEHAEKAGCFWTNIDGGADKVEGLPTFEW